MKENLKTYLNLLITVLLIGASVAWMVTVASQGELVTYNRELVINTLDIDVVISEYNTDTLAYEPVVNPNISINNMAPNDTKQFKIDITNNGNTPASTTILLVNITGDIQSFGNRLSIGVSSPVIKNYPLQDSLIQTTSGNYMIKLLENYTTPPLQTSSIYWYITIDKTATNEIASKTLSIEHINFIKP